MRVGVPRVLSFFYYFPFYKVFIEKLGCCSIELSSPTNAGTLDKLSFCPTDEPCISIKLAFPHAVELFERGVDAVFLPSLISADRHSYYCPKHIGLPAMLRNGLELRGNKNWFISPSIDWKSSPRESINELISAGKTLGAPEDKARRALEAAWRFQNLFDRVAVQNRLTYPETLERMMGLQGFQRLKPFNTNYHRKRKLRVGIIGHSYTLYDYIGHHLVERLQECATVFVPEMVSRKNICRALSAVNYGRELWRFEQLIMGSALHWINNGLIDCLIMIGPFECGPEAILEVFLEDETSKMDIPFIILTVDELTGEAGLVTRLEAFMDTVSRSVEERKNLHQSKSYFVPHSIYGKRVLGFPAPGRLGTALASVFQGDNLDAVIPPAASRRTAELGAELSPEFMCYPLAVTLGQMRETLEAGANTLLMVGGKGRCRLGWYAQMQESLLKRAGYEFEMLTIESPLPLKTNYGIFKREVRQLFGGESWNKIMGRFILAYQIAAAGETGEKHLFALRAREANRGEGDRVYKKFEMSLKEVTSFMSLYRCFHEFRQESSSISLINDPPPFRVRLIGEIYAVFENFVNRDIAKMLGSLEDIRILVETEITILNWFRHNILHALPALIRQRTIRNAARPYLQEMVGGHGLDSIGLAALAPGEKVDGLVHLWPFTCMPEIIAQSILTRVSADMDIPVLTVIINEQSGEAGLQTRLESFAHILRERKSACKKNDLIAVRRKEGN